MLCEVYCCYDQKTLLAFLVHIPSGLRQWGLLLGYQYWMSALQYRGLLLFHSAKGVGIKMLCAMRRDIVEWMSVSFFFLLGNLKMQYAMK